MSKIHSQSNDYAFSRVPVSQRTSLFNIVLIRIGAVTALSQFIVGATLGNGMSFWQAMLATVLGSLILEVVSLALGFAGMQEGLTTSLLARWSGFGRLGSSLIGLSIALSLLGLFGVQNSILAEGLRQSLGDRLPFGITAALSGTALTLLVAFGFRGLNWTARVAVPLFLLVMAWMIYHVFTQHSSGELTAAMVEPAMSLGEGATMVAGGCIVGALMAPDMGRYCQNKRHVFWMITWSVIVGEIIINAIGVLMARALHTADVVNIMTYSAGWLGMLTVIASAVKVNDVILYSASLGMANAVEGVSGKTWRYEHVALALGLFGTLLSVIGILDHFIGYLSLLGVIFPPVAGVMMVDYYVLRTSRHLLDASRATATLPSEQNTPRIVWPSLVACAAGILIGLTVDYGIASLNALLAGAAGYWLLKVGTGCQWGVRRQ